MAKILKINDNEEFKRIYAKGKYFVSKCLVIYFLKNSGKNKRIGITASKKIGKAVKRNRARRLIIEAYRKISIHVKNGYDFVFLARTKTCELKMQDVLQSMIFQMKAAGLWK